MIRKQIIDGSRRYAEAYAAFQKLQDENPDFLAVGDQKTGVIGDRSTLPQRSCMPRTQALKQHMADAGGAGG